MHNLKALAPASLGVALGGAETVLFERLNIARQVCRRDSTVKGVYSDTQRGYRLQRFRNDSYVLNDGRVWVLKQYPSIDAMRSLGSLHSLGMTALSFGCLPAPPPARCFKAMRDVRLRLETKLL